MANEATIRSGLGIRIADSTTGRVLLDYKSSPQQFTADVSGARGPTPGLVNVSVSGTDIDLSKLTTPGLCWVQNLDATNYVLIGVYEPDTDFFYPFLELLPGEGYCLRLPRFVNRETTGTGTQVSYNSLLRAVANTATCRIRFEAFEK